MEKRSRAFIAAPLIGTIVFLTAIVFVVNINKADAAEVKQVVSDAYHNRIVSLLELYRADLGALFRESMGRLIETALAEPSWTLFNVPLYPGSHTESEKDSTPRTQLHRLDSCKRVKEVLDAVICADTSVSCNPEATSEEECEASGCEWKDGQCVPGNVARYGLQEWVQNLKESGSFEGVLFTPAGEIPGTNYTRFDYFIQPTLNPACRDNPSLLGCSYVLNCKKIIPGILFDCANFAKNNSQPFRCCRKYRRGDSLVLPTEADYAPQLDDECIEPVEGCEHGNFFVQIKIEDPQVFPNLPRLQATDGAGNEIRSGAIADADFYLPIKYPIFKYMDASFRIYDRLAYGEKGTAYDRETIEFSADGSGQPGIVSGLFIGTADTCGGVASLEGIPDRFQSDSAGLIRAELSDSSTERKEDLRNTGVTYFEQVEEAVQAAGAHLTPGHSLAVRFYELSDVTGFEDDVDEFNCTIGAGGGVECSPPVGASPSAAEVFGSHFASNLRDRRYPVSEEERGGYCAYADRMPLYSQIIDFDPAYRVSMTKPNTFSWLADLRLWEGGATNPLG